MCFPSPPRPAAAKAERLTDFSALQRAGAVAVTDDGKPILDDDVMRMALRLGAELNFPVVQHAEDTRLTENCSMHAGPTSFRLGLRAMPAAAEAAIVDRDVTLAQQIRESRLHVAHLSTADALKAVRRGKRAKARVTCEVTPHHFTLIDENVGEYDTNFKMNPPLRSSDGSRSDSGRARRRHGGCDRHRSRAARRPRKDRWSSSAPRSASPDWKPRWPWRSRNCIAITRFRLTRIVELFTAGPARVFDLAGRGTLARGSHADVTIFDPKKRWTFEAAKSHSLSHNTPFDGWQFTGKVVATIVGGKIVYRAD